MLRNQDSASRAYQGLSTVAFLHGRKHLICTRRNPKLILSDNATYFVGAFGRIIVIVLWVLSIVELRTVAFHILAVIHSRPIVLLSESPANQNVLTPAHFLFGGPPDSFDEPAVTSRTYIRLAACILFAAKLLVSENFTSAAFQVSNSMTWSSGDRPCSCQGPK